MPNDGTYIPNPTGKGGFGDNPQNRTHGGRWSKETSISYWQNKFIRMPLNEFEQWAKDTPKKDRTMAMEIAYQNVKKSKEDLLHQKELTDRTEGKAKQYTDITSGDEKLSLNVTVTRPDVKDEITRLSEDK